MGRAIQTVAMPIAFGERTHLPTICDGLGEGFRTIAVREAIGDRVPGAVAWNLYDINAKFADVLGVEECVAYLNSVNGVPLAAE